MQTRTPIWTILFFKRGEQISDAVLCSVRGYDAVQISYLRQQFSLSSPKRLVLAMFCHHPSTDVQIFFTHANAYTWQLQLSPPNRSSPHMTPTRVHFPFNCNDQGLPRTISVCMTWTISAGLQSSATIPAYRLFKASFSTSERRKAVECRECSQRSRNLVI